MKTILVLVSALVVATAPLTSCGGSDTAKDQTLTVLAASSLTGVFTKLGAEFEKQHPGTTVKFAFDSSATLAQQAIDGAPADVLATADLPTMQLAADGDALNGDSQVFATNTMVLVTPSDNPAGIASFADLQRESVSYVVCVDTAPCGKVAGTLLTAEGITHPPASLEPDVKAVLARVVGNEADAGLVYATDAVAAGDGVAELEIPGAAEAVTTYPIATLAQSTSNDLAAAFLALVVGETGQKMLSEAGFGAP